MFGLFKRRTIAKKTEPDLIEADTTQIKAAEKINEIESAVYEHIKPYGFRKYGRTLHRFVSGDISQVINFQRGMHGMGESFCVNLGIRIPECAERNFHPSGELKKYYPEYECTMRSRLKKDSDETGTWYDLSEQTDIIIKSIINALDRYVLPAYENLNSREAILAHRREYPMLDDMSSLFLDESMIYGHIGNTEKAKEMFELHYQSAVEKYNDLTVNGKQHYLKKGDRIVFMGQDITAEKDGYVTLYGASHAHIDYLDELAIKLGIR